MQPCKENTDRMDISCRSLRQWAMSLLLTQAYLRAIRKLAMNLASALVWGSYPIVQTFTRTPAQEAQWPDQLAGQMKAKEHTESKPNKDISSILPVILFSWGINVINWCFFCTFFLMMIMDYSIIVAISPGCKCCCLTCYKGCKAIYVWVEKHIGYTVGLCYGISLQLFLFKKSWAWKGIFW
jgi:hypothetical protein